jgi:hypothetical protein
MKGKGGGGGYDFQTDMPHTRKYMCRSLSYFLLALLHCMYCMAAVEFYYKKL